MKIIEEKKLNYKNKGVRFEHGNLIDEDGNRVNLIDELKTIFKDEYFDIAIVSSFKTEYPIEHFEENEDEDIM